MPLRDNWWQLPPLPPTDAAALRHVLAEIKGRADQASPLPWDTYREQIRSPRNRVAIVTRGRDLEFLSRSKQDILWLLQVVHILLDEQRQWHASDHRG